MYIDKIQVDGSLYDVKDTSSGYITKSNLNTALSSKQDTLTAGTNITIDQNNVISATGGSGATYTAGDNIDITNNVISATDTTYNNATALIAGLMSGADKSKLDGISYGAEVNVQANWNETDTTSDSYIQNKPTIPDTTNMEVATNKVTSISPNSTNTQYPSALAVYNLFASITDADSTSY